MTIDTMTLKARIEKGSNDALIWKMIGFVANRMMDMDAEDLTDAAYGESSLATVNRRNDYRERSWETSAGTVEGSPSRCQSTHLTTRRSPSLVSITAVQLSTQSPQLT
jgi:transposase-like protein